MNHLQLSEFTKRTEVALTPEQVALLGRSLPDLRISPTLGQPGLFDLTPGSTVGTIVGESLRVDIAPKVGPLNLLYMMSFPFNPAVWGTDLAAMDTAAHLVEAVLPTFLVHCEQALRRGPLTRYRSQEEQLQTIRGRLLFERQLRTTPGIPLPAHVRYDDLTVDVLENRLIRAALHRLRPLASAPTHKQRLARLDHVLAEVTVVTINPTGLPPLTFDRLNEHYRTVAHLAALILSGTGLEHRTGKHQAATFLADMNKVFEDFVVTSLRQALQLDEKELDQGSRHHRVYLDAPHPHTGQVRLKPDISWWRNGSCVFVGDVKYKRLATQGYEHPDLYQVLAYLTALDLDEGLLIYPVSEAEPRTFTVPLAGKRLTVCVLPLDGEPAQIQGEVNKLAHRIRHLAQPPTSINPLTVPA